MTVMQGGHQLPFQGETAMPWGTGMAKSNFSHHAERLPTRKLEAEVGVTHWCAGRDGASRVGRQVSPVPRTWRHLGLSHRTKLASGDRKNQISESTEAIVRHHS